MLLPSSPDLKVNLRRKPVDMRAIAREVMQQDPFVKTCSLFTNKRQKAFNILVCDINVFLVWHKPVEGQEKVARACVSRTWF